jgi:hypothetical protein
MWRLSILHFLYFLLSISPLLFGDWTFSVSPLQMWCLSLPHLVFFLFPLFLSLYRVSNYNVIGFCSSYGTSYWCANITYLWLYRPLLVLGRFYSFVILYTVGRTPWTGDQPVERPLPTHRTTQTQNKHTPTYMPWIGFEPTIPVLERAKTVHALDRTATMIGCTDTT